MDLEDASIEYGIPLIAVLLSIGIFVLFFYMGDINTRLTELDSSITDAENSYGDYVTLVKIRQTTEILIVRMIQEHMYGKGISLDHAFVFVHDYDADKNLWEETVLTYSDWEPVLECEVSLVSGALGCVLTDYGKGYFNTTYL